MLEIKPEQANAYDGDVILRKSLFANDLRKRRNIFKINIGYASYSRGNYTPEKAERKRLQTKNALAGRTFVDRRI